MGTLLSKRCQSDGEGTIIVQHFIVKGKIVDLDQISGFSWFGPRRAFPPIYNYAYRPRDRLYEQLVDRYTSDVNWGCMFRSVQMLLCHLLCDSYGIEVSSNSNAYKLLMSCFIDSSNSVFSIHSMLRLSKLDPGKRIGPTTAAYMLKDLIHANTTASRKISIFIAENGILINNDIIEKINSKNTVEDNDDNDDDNDDDDSSHNKGGKRVHFDPMSNDDYGDITNEPTLLILCPVFLNRTDEELNELINFLSIPQSFGCLGGVPGKASYIIGLESHTDSSGGLEHVKLLCLDPHKPILPAISVKTPYDMKRFAAQSTLATGWASRALKRIAPDDLDSCLCLAFRIKNMEDWERLSNEIMNSNNMLLNVIERNYSPITHDEMKQEINAFPKDWNFL